MKEKLHIDLLKVLLQKLEIQELRYIHNSTGFEEFNVGVSLVYMLIQKYLSCIISDDDVLKHVEIIANDVDVYHVISMTPDNNEDK